MRGGGGGSAVELDDGRKERRECGGDGHRGGVVGGLGEVEVLIFKDRFFFDARTDAFDLTFGVEIASFLKFVSQK